MRPGNYDMNVYRGDTYTWRVSLWQDYPGGVPADLTGVTAKAEVRDRPGGTLYTTLTTAIEAPNVVVVKWTTAKWVGVNITQGAWDLQLTYPDTDASVITVLAGAVNIRMDVTDTAAALAARTAAAAPVSTRQSVIDLLAKQS